MAGIDRVKYPSLPSNYVSIAELKERWLKEKEKKQQEKEKQENEGKKKQYPAYQNRIANGCIRSRAPVGKNLHKRENRSGKGWREVGLIAKEPYSKEVKITAPVVVGVDGARGKKKMGYFGKRKPRVERDGSGNMAKVSTIDVADEEMMAVVSVENGGKDSSKGKCKWNSENQEVKEVATVCMVEVVDESKFDREIAGQNCGVGYREKKNSWRKMGDRVGEVSNKADSVEQSGQKHNAGKEVVSVDVKERNNEKVRVRGAFHAYGDTEVASVCTVEVVGENKVDREITGMKCGVGFRGKKHSERKMGDRVGEVSDKADRAEQSGQERNAEKEKVSVDVKERTNEKVRVGGAFHAYGDKEVEEVATVFTVEVVEDNKVNREITGKKGGVGFRGKKHSGRKVGDRVGFTGKKHSWRKIGDRVGEVSDKADSVEQSGQERSAEKEVVSVAVKERTNEKVRVKGAFCAYGDKEVEEVATVCTVEVVEENKVDREISGKNCRVGFRGNERSGRKMANWVGEVYDKADSAERSGQERNAEKEEVSVDVKERTNEKASVRGAFRAYSDKSKDVLIDLEAGLKMMIEEDLVDLSLTDKRYGHGRSNVRVYGDKWRYGSSRSYEPRNMLKQRDNSFVWIKKGESSNGNVAEIETQG